MNLKTRLFLNDFFSYEKNLSLFSNVLYKEVLLVPDNNRIIRIFYILAFIEILRLIMSLQHLHYFASSYRHDAMLIFTFNETFL